MTLFSPEGEELGKRFVAEVVVIMEQEHFARAQSLALQAGHQ